MAELEDIARGQGADARYARRVLKRRAARRAEGGSDAGDLAPLIDALDDLTDRLAPDEQRRLGRDIATDLRTSNARRIRANVQPEGEPMAPRKRQPDGRLRAKRERDPATRQKRFTRQERMFRRAADPRYLRKESSMGEAQVGFVGAMARIMRVHQYGLRDTVTRDPASPAVTYPARVVLGIAADDRLRILDRITAQIG